MKEITLSEQTHIRMTIAGLIGLGVTAFGAAAFVMEQDGITKEATRTAEMALEQAQDATHEVQELSLVVKIGNVQREIRDFQAELRELQREKETHPASSLIQGQILDVQHELSNLKLQLACLRQVSPEEYERCE